MKFTFVLFFLCFGISVNADSGDDKDTTKRDPKKPWIHIVKYKENVVELHAKSPHKGLGVYIFFFPRRVLGAYEIQPDGLLFTPFINAPDDIPQKQFEQYWNDGLSPEQMFIPFSTITRVKKWYGVKIKTREGEKITFATHHAKKMVKEIQSHLDVGIK